MLVEINISTDFLIWKFSSEPSTLDLFVCLQMCFGGMGSHECHRNPIKNISYISVFFNEKPDSALHSSPFPQMVSVTARVTIAAETSLLLPQCLSQEQAQAIQRARRQWYLYIETIPLSLFPTCL